MSYGALLITIIVSSLLTNNIVLSQSLGICPFLGVSRKMDSAVGMGVAVTFVVSISSSLCWILYTYVLVPVKIEYLQSMSFIFIIAALVQFIDIFLKRFSPVMYRSLGVYLALITTNCVVLGTANSVISSGYDLFQTFTAGLFTGLGFMLALILMAGIRERVSLAPVPKPFKGLPIALIIAGLMSMAFMGFSGLKFF